MKEIIRKNGIQAISDVMNGPDIYGDAIKMYIPHEYMEVFARKIVQECASIYERIDNGNLVEGTDDYVLALQRVFFSEEK